MRHFPGLFGCRQNLQISEGNISKWHGGTQRKWNAVQLVKRNTKIVKKDAQEGNERQPRET